MNNLAPRTSLSDEMLPTVPCDYRHMDDGNVPREVFRNKTTSVEVIVKQVVNKNKKKCSPSETAANNSKASDLYAGMEMLKNELHKANNNLEKTRQCFSIVLCEIKKQLDAANQRELRRQTKYLLLQLEKEKLKSLLESKTNLVRKLKKELLSMRRILKFVINGIHCIPHLFEDECEEYSEFEKDLKQCASNKETAFDCITLDSILSSKM